MKTMNEPAKPLLLAAHDIINGERMLTYGPAENGMQGVADQWALYLRQKYKIDIHLTAEDACWMMVDLKKFRQMHKSKRDNIIDAAGYIGIIERVI
jgi:hypothetical protein